MSFVEFEELELVQGLPLAGRTPAAAYREPAKFTKSRSF
jgi:hypothetical protein